MTTGATAAHMCGYKKGFMALDIEIKKLTEGIEAEVVRARTQRNLSLLWQYSDGCTVPRRRSRLQL
jgi:hypothetical protein